MKEVLVYGLKNMWGGLEKYLLMMHEQIHQEIRFVYLMEECDCIHQEQVSELGGELVYVPPKHPLKAHLKALSSVLKEQRKRIDTLYININSVTFDIAVVLLGMRYGYRLVIHSHNAGMEFIKHPMYRMLHKTIEVFALGILKCVKATRLAVSDRAADYLFKGSAYEIVVPGIDIRQFAFDSDQRQAIRERLEVQDAYVYGFVGRLESVKNPEYLLEVFAEIVRKSDLDCRLVMVGDGSLRERLVQKTREMHLEHKVIFTGDTKNPAMYYQAMDYMIMPSQSEGLSMVAIEAQACGLPFACSEGRFPKTIAITPLLKFIPLESGAEKWADICIAHRAELSGNDRNHWNKIVLESCFETKTAAAHLKQILLDS